MNEPIDIDALVRRALSEVAPEVAPELDDLDRHVDLWRELELDSMDHLSVMTKLSEATGREIPERDYPHLLSLQAISDYLR
jgi:acyl carrier protein